MGKRYVSNRIRINRAWLQSTMIISSPGFALLSLFVTLYIDLFRTCLPTRRKCRTYDMEAETQLPLKRYPDFSVSSLIATGLYGGASHHHKLVPIPMGEYLADG